MANKRNRPMPKVQGAPTGKTGHSAKSLNESVANYPGLPGKTGPDRTNGVKKLKIHPQSQGI